MVREFAKYLHKKGKRWNVKRYKEKCNDNGEISKYLHRRIVVCKIVKIKVCGILTLKKKKKKKKKKERKEFDENVKIEKPYPVINVVRKIGQWKLIIKSKAARKFTKLKHTHPPHTPHPPPTPIPHTTTHTHTHTPTPHTHTPTPTPHTPTHTVTSPEFILSYQKWLRYIFKILDLFLTY